MTLFKSPLRRRIEAKLVELVREYASLESRKRDKTITKDTTDYCHYVIEQGNIQREIDLLRSLLK